MRRTTFAALCLLLLGNRLLQAERLTPEKLWDLARIGDAAVSPDGKTLAYLVTRYDLEQNEGTTSLMLQPLPSGDRMGGDKTAIAFETMLLAPKATTLLKDIKGLGSLGWLNHPSGAKLVYIAPASDDMNGGDEASKKEADQGEEVSDKEADKDDDKEAEGKPQVWTLDPNGGDAQQLTHVEQGVANLKPSPRGDAIAFTADVKLDAKVPEVYRDLPKADARIIDSLMYRHWNQWHDYAYSHVHVVQLDEQLEASEPIDLMESLKADCPLPPFGGSEQFAFSPDGKEIALTMKLVNNPAESTDSGIYLVSVDGGTLKNVTPGMPGYDMDPAYSPDGRFLAFHSMRRAGFESDRSRIMLYDRSSGEIDELTEGLDQTSHHATWSHDSQRVYFSSETRGTTQLFSIALDTGLLEQGSNGRFDFSVVSAIPDSNRILLRQQNMLRPTELAVLDASTKQLATITDVNGKLFDRLELPKIEQRFFKATDGKMIHNWVILPPDYDSEAERPWPMLTYCQGGPQGQIGQWFSYRWNFHMMASHGYVVLAVNRRGMPGFGREWNDQISGDWGGQAMQDILASTDAMMADPKIDRERVAAIGASFGGYTVYWLMGNDANRFCAMAAHCGVYNLNSMYGATEELFFVNHDLGGPYWKSEAIAEEYELFSPHTFAGNWKTPLLVIHGEKDFRVPVTQGMEAFTAAQVQGVESRFLYFPEEGHWVLSPQNGVLWGRVFFDWLDRYCKP
ncbi:S9 family peptidase [Novipirellula artificiosorum]|uniref:Prolyl tripeptidyl peptidase n=1 Tax=Novipirellula artificiosorum TaxID=2528016 RepID=A0A5C6DYY8_9BACT|nr:S9 family peptidase [Novipirellula artificiosorum]TWU41762.1 Prolyl tripeptidyl peptidase precursor [Novipirellula artificiosorum]